MTIAQGPLFLAGPTRSSRAARALEALGVSLGDRIATLLLALVATKRRVLLVGDPGMGKTLLARRLGHALAGDKISCLDAALTSFDDVRGFVKPSSLDKGEVEIVAGPWSPYRSRFLFVDELSRANTWQQGRWLQLVHERRVDGLPTDLQWVLCAMNPGSAEGASPLALALADRFHGVVHMDAFETLTATQREHIAAGWVSATNADPEDGDGARDAAADLRLFVQDCELALARLDARPATRLGLTRVALAAIDAYGARGGPRFQGRRAVHLRQTLESVVAACEAEHGDRGLVQARGLLDATIGAGLFAITSVTDHASPDHERAERAALMAARIAWHQAFGGPAEKAPAIEGPTPHSHSPRLTRRALMDPTIPVADAIHAMRRAWSAGGCPPLSAPPLAVLAPGGSEGRACRRDSLWSRSLYVVPVSSIPESVRATLPAATVASELGRRLLNHTRGGVYHPAATPTDVPFTEPVAVFGLHTRDWAMVRGRGLDAAAQLSISLTL